MKVRPTQELGSKWSYGSYGPILTGITQGWETYSPCLFSYDPWDDPPGQCGQWMPKDITYTFIILYTYNVYVYVYVYIYIHAYNVYVYIYIHIYIYPPIMSHSATTFQSFSNRLPWGCPDRLHSWVSQVLEALAGSLRSHPRLTMGSPRYTD